MMEFSFLGVNCEFKTYNFTSRRTVDLTEQ